MIIRLGIREHYIIVFLVAILCWTIPGSEGGGGGKILLLLICIQHWRLTFLNLVDFYLSVEISDNVFFISFDEFIR